MRKPEIVQVLERYPNGAEIKVLAEEMDLEEGWVRDRIGAARRAGWKIKRIEFRTFQLFEGRYRGRHQ